MSWETNLTWELMFCGGNRLKFSWSTVFICIHRRREKLHLIKVWKSLKAQLYVMRQSTWSTCCWNLLIKTKYLSYFILITLLIMTSLANNCSYNCSQSEEEEKVAPLCTDLETKVNKHFSFVGAEVSSESIWKFNCCVLFSTQLEIWIAVNPTCFLIFACLWQSKCFFSWSNQHNEKDRVNVTVLHHRGSVMVPGSLMFLFLLSVFCSAFTGLGRDVRGRHGTWQEQRCC